MGSSEKAEQAVPAVRSISHGEGLDCLLVNPSFREVSAGILGVGIVEQCVLIKRRYRAVERYGPPKSFLFPGILFFPSFLQPPVSGLRPLFRAKSRKRRRNLSPARR